MKKMNKVVALAAVTSVWTAIAAPIPQNVPELMRCEDGSAVTDVGT